MYKRVRLRNGVVVIDGVKYWNDKPYECCYCWFWLQKAQECELGKNNCYYRLDYDRSQLNSTENCSTCCYTQDGICVSATCYQKLYAELRKLREKQSAKKVKKHQENTSESESKVKSPEDTGQQAPNHSTCE